MKKFSFLTICILLLSYSNAVAFKVAIFDFDDRLREKYTTAKYIEKKLKQTDRNISTYQFSGKSSVALSVKIMEGLDEGGYDLIIIVTSDALIIAHHVIKKTPTLYTNVNNPLSLGYRTLGPPGGNISGASYYVSIEKQLTLHKKILPELKTVGFIFDRNNKSKRVEIPESRKACEKLGIKYKIAVVSHYNELNSTVEQLIKEGVDALSVGSSGMIYNKISAFIATCNRAKIPVFSFNKKGIKQGAVAALASDYNLMVDELIIPMVLKVLKNGASPGEMPVAFLDDNLIFLNFSQVKKLNLTIPPDIREKAILVH